MCSPHGHSNTSSPFPLPWCSRRSNYRGDVKLSRFKQIFNSHNCLLNFWMPRHAHIIIAAPHSDVSRFNGWMFHGWRKPACTSAYLLENSVWLVSFLCLQLLRVERLVVERVLVFNTWDQTTSTQINGHFIHKRNVLTLKCGWQTNYQR